jgi:hypothetical protein
LRFLNRSCGGGDHYEFNQGKREPDLFHALVLRTGATWGSPRLAMFGVGNRISGDWRLRQDPGVWGAIEYQWVPSSVSACRAAKVYLHELRMSGIGDRSP